MTLFAEVLEKFPKKFKLSKKYEGRCYYYCYKNLKVAFHCIEALVPRFHCLNDLEAILIMQGMRSSKIRVIYLYKNGKIRWKR